MLLEEMDNLMSKNPNDDYRMKNREYTAEERRATFGHPKELIEKLHTACLSVKLTVENMPKLVERMEQKRIHFIKHVLGGWKPNPRAKTLTDQIVQV